MQWISDKTSWKLSPLWFVNATKHFPFKWSKFSHEQVNFYSAHVYIRAGAGTGTSHWKVILLLRGMWEENLLSSMIAEAQPFTGSHLVYQIRGKVLHFRLFYYVRSWKHVLHPMMLSSVFDIAVPQGEQASRGNGRGRINHLGNLQLLKHNGTPEPYRDSFHHI